MAALPIGDELLDGVAFSQLVTIMGLYFQQSSQQSYQNGVANCWDLGVRKFWLLGFKTGEIHGKINCYIPF